MKALSQTLERYLSLRKAAHPSTVRPYRIHISSLIEFLRRCHVEVDGWGKLRRTHVEEWLLMLATASPPYTNDTRRQFIFHVRRFFRDISRWGWPESPPPRVFLARDLPRSDRARPFNQRSKDSKNGSDRTPETQLHSVLDRYLSVRAATLRPRTVRHYRQCILSFIRFICTRFPEVDSFTKLKRYPHIEGWLLDLASATPPFASATRGKRIYTISRFFEDIWEWNWPDSPQSGLIYGSDYPPEPRYLPRPLPPDVDVRLLEALKDEGSLISLGLVLARRTGLRIGELSRLELDCCQEVRQIVFSYQFCLNKSI